MTERQPNDWIWTAAVAAASSIAAMLAVWFLVISPQLLDPGASMRREADRKQLLNQFALELTRASEQQRDIQKHQFELGMKQLEAGIAQRLDGAVERAMQRQLSEEFLKELRDRVIDQARQAGPATSQAPVLAPALAAAAVDAMLRKDLAKMESGKLAATEYWHSTGHTATNNAAAGLAAAETYAGDLLRSMTLVDNGSLRLAFDPRIGVEEARVVLTPDPKPGVSIEWRCATNIPAVLSIAPLCELRLRLPD